MSEDIIVPEVDFEKEARLQNWVPQDEFKGPKDEWIDAKTFVERGKQINPILRANNERLMRELDKTKKQMEELRATTEEFKSFQKEAYEHKAAALAKEIFELREQKKQAISDGDGAKTLEIEDKIDALKEEKAAAKTEQKQEEKKEVPVTQTDPDLEAWVGDNHWYATSQSMAEVANTEAARINALYPTLRGKDFLERLDEALEGIFTLEKLGRKSAKVKTMVEGASGGSRSPQAKNAHSYENLPSDARSACDRYVKQKLMTREDYVASYQWE